MSAIDQFKEADFLVQATDEEQTGIWYRFVHTEKLIQKWEQHGGFLTKIGNYHKRPICISTNLVVIDGLKVVFYEPTSELVDWRMVEAFRNKHFTKQYNGRLAHTNATNFHNAYHAICDRREGKI